MTDKMKTIGSRAEVWHSTAKKTSGGLKKADLIYFLLIQLHYNAIFLFY